MRIYGVDFSSAPRRDKQIAVAICEGGDRGLNLAGFHSFSDWPAYEQWLAREQDWIGGFDFPFGLPRHFVEKQGWPNDWAAMVSGCVELGKERFAETAMRAFLSAKSGMEKHRKTDFPANSHSPLKTRTNPPVGLMFYEGAWRLLQLRIHLPRMRETGSSKIAVEAYPGLVARRLGARYYKNDKPHNATTNKEARARIVDRLQEGALGFEVSNMTVAYVEMMQHASGDWLDAVLCATQAYWAWQRRDIHFGLPEDLDPVEGWIVSA